MGLSARQVIRSMHLKEIIDHQYIRYQLRILHTALSFQKNVRLYEPDWSIDSMLYMLFSDTSNGIKIFDGPIWYGQQRRTKHLVVLTDSNAHTDPRPVNEWINLCKDVGITMTSFERKYTPMIGPYDNIPTIGKLVPTNYDLQGFRKGVVKGILLHDHLRKRFIPNSNTK